MGREFSDAQARSPNLVGVGSAKEIAFIAKYFGGSDGTRTRGLLRDRQAF